MLPFTIDGTIDRGYVLFSLVALAYSVWVIVTHKPTHRVLMFFDANS